MKEERKERLIVVRWGNDERMCSKGKISTKLRHALRVRNVHSNLTLCTDSGGEIEKNALEAEKCFNEGRDQANAKDVLSKSAFVCVKLREVREGRESEVK